MLNKYGGWIKKFYDNNQEYGFDCLIKDKKSSWNKGRLNDIETVSLFNKRSHVKYYLSIPNTEWHQFDRFHAIASESDKALSYRAGRVIQAKILPEHVSMKIAKRKVQGQDDVISYYFFLEQLDSGLGGENIITQQAVDRWLSLILLPDNKCAIQMAEKGKIKWQAVHI